MDYEKLLRKYMAHVLNWEGVTFTDLMDGADISLDEQAELKRIAREVAGETEE